MTVFSLSSGNGSIYTVRYGCCGCYSCFLQLAYVYCISSINAVSYACNTAVFIYVYFTIDGSSIAEQFYGCALTVSKFAYHAAHCTQGQACTAIADGFDIFQVFVQLNLNLSAVIAYANILIAAEVNSFAGFNVGCFGCNTVGRQIPACISSVAYFFQLAYVYCISSINAVSYACDTAVFIYVYFTIDGSSIAEQFYGCALTVSKFAYHAAHCTQSQCCAAVADGFNAYQILVQVYFVIGMTVFSLSSGNGSIYTVRYGCCGCYSCFLQLAYVYCISSINAVSYACNTAVFIYVYFTIDGSSIAEQFYGCALTVSKFAYHAAHCTQSQCCTAIADGFDIFQVFIQFNAYSSTVIAYADVLIAAEVNSFAGFYIGCSTAVSRNVPACICSVAYFFQLAYVYCVFIRTTVSYTANGAILSYFYFTINFSTATHKVYRCLTVS